MIVSRHFNAKRKCCKGLSPAARFGVDEDSG